MYNGNRYNSLTNKAKTLFLFLLLAVSATQSQATLSDSTYVHQIEQVVVTGSNQATSRNLLPYTVSVVNAQQLETTGKTQLLSALSGVVPSMFVSQRNILGFGVSNGGGGGIKIRGVGGSPTNGILMMVDSQPQFAGLFSHPIADYYTTEYVDHVEILRGPGSVLYGSNAMGGVINVITKNAQHDGIHTTLKSQYGSYNTWQTALSNMVRMGRFSSLVTMGYDRTDGMVENFDFKQINLYAKIGYELSRYFRLSADYSLVNIKGNDPIYAQLRNASYIIHQNITRGETSLAFSNKFQNTDGAVRFYYSYGNHYIDDPKHFHSLDDRFGIIAYQNVNVWQHATGTIGFDFNTYRGKIPMSGGSTSGAGTLEHKSITEYSPYLTLQQSLFNNILILNGGLRMANSDKFDSHWLPQVGFSFHPTEDWCLKASMAKGYRNPSFRELYLYPPHNPDLDPESMMNYEVTISHRFSRYLNTDITGYFAQGRNIIQTLNGKNNNTGCFRNKGLELSITSQPIAKLLLRASYSYMYSSLKELTAAPKNQYLIGANWQPLPRFNIDAELKGVGALYVANEVARQNYTLLNLGFTYNVTSHIDLSAHFDNLTDADYMINNGYKMPGITCMGGFKLKL